MSDFRSELERQLSVAQADSNKNLWKIGEWFMDRVKEAINNSDLSKISKADFLKMVSDAYDKFVAPIDLPGPDVVLDPLLKSIVLNQASRLYDKLVQPQAPSLSNAQ
jgi:hypothetical protein